MSISVNIKVLDDGLDLPSFATHSSAGMDLYAAVRDNVTLMPMQRLLIPTGIAIALPDGFEAQIRPRSGLSLKHGITCLNTPGTIDADYRGEISVLLINLGQEPFIITRGMRIAQMIIGQYSRIEWEVVQSLDETARGVGGFGSTGLK